MGRFALMLTHVYKETHTHTMVVEHDVLRLQVSVDDALLVQVAQSHGDLCQVETNEKRMKISSTN